MSYFPNNSKFKQGDIVLLVDYHQNRSVAKGEVIGWRGGGVAGYVVKVIEPLVCDTDYAAGQTIYKSGRDMKLFDRAERPMNYRLTTEEKLDLLLEHLGLEIEVEPRVIKVKADEEAGD